MVHTKYPGATDVRLNQLTVYKFGTKDFYVDIVYFGAQEPTTDFDGNIKLLNSL